ncbi:hypothetical protein V8C86DRAFT_1816908, partial [Haematococcus lacustris]
MSGVSTLAGGQGLRRTYHKRQLPCLASAEGGCASVPGMELQSKPSFAALQFLMYCFMPSCNIFCMETQSRPVDIPFLTLCLLWCIVHAWQQCNNHHVVH